jgi:hypothetical protein
MKTCNRCGELKQLTDFRRERTASSGRGATCSRCVANDAQRRYHANGGREKQRVRRMNLRADRHETIESIKDVPCSDCGGRFPRVCMDFDHVRGVKVQSISRMIHESYPWDAILEEIAKCDVVCANCHRVRTATRGHWYGQPVEESAHE